jgi:hypothetical protein
MSVDPAHLMEEVYNLLSNVYSSSASKQAILAFEAFGLPISDAMFKLNPSDATLSAPLAVERISDIVNRSLNVQGTSVAWGMATVDGAIKLCLESSMPLSADAAASLGAAKRDAEGPFDATLGSLSGVSDDRFHPVYTTPVDWYVSGAAANWTAHTVGQQPPPTAPAPAPVPAPVWRVLPVSMQPHLAVVPAPGHPLLATAAPATTVSPLRERAVLASFGASATTPISVLHSGAALQGVTMAAGTPAASAASPAPALQRSMMLSSAVLALNASTTAQPVVTNSIGMSFEHCIVLLNRPWFPDSYLMLRNWYVPGYARSDISNGIGPGDPGILPVITTGFVAIRNLKIASTWSQADLAAVQGSAAFGPFSLIGRSYDTASGTLTCPGIQIVGWFCSPMPVLPPASDPNLPAAKT